MNSDTYILQILLSAKKFLFSYSLLFVAIWKINASFEYVFQGTNFKLLFKKFDLVPNHLTNQENNLFYTCMYGNCLVLRKIRTVTYLG